MVTEYFPVSGFSISPVLATDELPVSFAVRWRVTLMLASPIRRALVLPLGYLNWTCQAPSPFSVCDMLL